MCVFACENVCLFGSNSNIKTFEVTCKQMSTAPFVQGGLICLNEEEVKRMSGEFAKLVNQFDGYKLSDGTVIQAKEDMIKFVLV